jgi:predicted cation transporter
LIFDENTQILAQGKRVFVETAGMITIAVLVALLPALVKPVGEQLEIFLLVAGAASVTVTSQWSIPLVREALLDPLMITGAVLAAGFLFHFLRPSLHRGIERLRIIAGPSTMAACLVILLGIISSVITAIIAALVLVEIARSMHLARRTETRLVILSCFSIGLGAALTPYGGPLAAIAVSKLSGTPYQAGFWFLLEKLWMFVIPGIVLLGGGAVLLMKTGAERDGGTEPEAERLPEVFVRTAKVYIFVFGLVLLGRGFTPIIERHMGSVPSLALFWVNSASAVLDNATLAAAEIVPSMRQQQLVAALLGLLISGGMLVPGNIPNIIAAGRLKIGAGEWAKFGVPAGVVMMIACFAVLMVMR